MSVIWSLRMGMSAETARLMCARPPHVAMFAALEAHMGAVAASVLEGLRLTGRPNPCLKAALRAVVWADSPANGHGRGESVPQNTVRKDAKACLRVPETAAASTSLQPGGDVRNMFAGGSRLGNPYRVENQAIARC